MPDADGPAGASAWSDDSDGVATATPLATIVAEDDPAIGADAVMGIAVASGTVDDGATQAVMMSGRRTTAHDLDRRVGLRSRISDLIARSDA